MDLCSHMSSDHSEHFVKKETSDARKKEIAKESEPEIREDKQELEAKEEIVKVKVNYILDEVKNL